MQICLNAFIFILIIAAAVGQDREVFCCLFFRRVNLVAEIWVKLINFNTIPKIGWALWALRAGFPDKS